MKTICSAAWVFLLLLFADPIFGLDIFAVVEKGDTAYLAVFLKKGGNVDTADETGKTVLMKAVKNNSVPAMKFPDVEIDKNIIKPDYVHGIVLICSPVGPGSSCPIPIALY